MTNRLRISDAVTADGAPANLAQVDFIMVQTGVNAKAPLIGEVSTETARLIERISADTQDQAATAGRVAATMKDILAVTEQTSLGTRQTAVSIGQLAELAVELKGSVSGFKV